MKVALILALALILAIGLLVIMWNYSKKLKDEKKRLEQELEKQKSISDELCFYVEEIARVNGDKDKVSQQIQEAKNEEEVLNIIHGLVRANNDRVCDKATQ